jgi:short-subunit dehydrogenase
MPFAIITGASRGIGKAFATELAKRGRDLILLARSQDHLNRLKSELEKNHGIRALTYAIDLCDTSAIHNFVSFCSKENLAIDTLINNAGIGVWGNFAEKSLAAQSAMLTLNMTSVLTLTHELLPILKKQNKSFILNVASLAGFFPMPYFAAYAATKSFLLSLSQGLASELKSQNVVVTCLCPGPTQSDFFTYEDTKDFRWKDSPFFMSAESVVAAGLSGLAKGKRVVVPGLANKVFALSGRFLPRILFDTIVRQIYKP